jgi:tetratricopeptide (TPR) repeat protein
MFKRFLLLMGVWLVVSAWPGACWGQTADVPALLEQAEEYVEDGNYAEAEAIYRGLIADYPGSEDGLAAQEGLTVLYIERDDTNEAEAAFEAMVEQFGSLEGLAKAVDHVADAYREVRDYEKARQIYRYAVDTWPDAEHAADSQRAVALTSILLGEEAEGQAAIDKLLADYAAHANIATAVDHLADDLRERARFEEARELYEWVVENCRDSDHAVNSLAGVARTSILMGDEASALTATERLLTEFKDTAKAARV